MVVNGAVVYANMITMPLLNVALFTDLLSASNLSQLNNLNTYNSHVNLNQNRIIN